MEVRVEIGEFAFRRLGGAVDLVAAVLPRAIDVYLADRDTDPPGWAYPTFLQEPESPRLVGVPISVDERTWGWIEEEASRRAISPSQLIGHAALYYLAALDADRL